MPYYNRDPKRDHNFDNHPYVLRENYIPLIMENQMETKLQIIRKLGLHTIVGLYDLYGYLGELGAALKEAVIQQIFMTSSNLSSLQSTDAGS